MKRIISAILVLSVVLSVSFAATAAEPVAPGAHVAEKYSVSKKVTLTVASSAASSNAAYSVQREAAKAITEASGGKVNFNVIWDGTLGNDSELIENCITGAIPIISLSSSPLVPYIPEAGVFDCPAVFQDDVSAREGIKKFEEVFAPIMEEAGLKLLAIDFSQWRGLSTNIELKAPEDFGKVKIRVMENNYHIAFWTNLGAQPTPLAFSELYTSLQQGLVNTQDNPLSTVFASKFIEVQKYWLPVTAFPFVNFRLMNLEQFEALEPEAQKAVIDFAQEDLEQEYWEQLKDDQKIYDRIKAGNEMKILDYTDDIKIAFTKAARPVWDSIAKSVGAEIVDKYLATGGQKR